jgi:hypothetical protein
MLLPSSSPLSVCLQDEDVLRGMTVNGLLANAAAPLKGLERRTCWMQPEAIAYGNMLPERKAQLQAIMDACSGDRMLSKIYAVRVRGFLPISPASRTIQSLPLTSADSPVRSSVLLSLSGV